jgi:phosphate transport system substrate-binding protein
MQKKFLATAAALAVSASALLAAVPASAASNITGKGSSFANNAIQYCASHYNPSNDDTVAYTSTGSGTGRAEFTNGTVNFAVSDGTYTAGASGTPTGRYVNVPLFGGPVVFAYNQTKTFKVGKAKHKMPAGLKLNADLISKILKGTITKWNDAAIKSLNKGKVLPNHVIDVYYRTSGSGTTANLTTYLSQTLGSGWLANNKDLAASAGGTLAAGALAKSTSSVIADLVESDLYGFGYFDLSDAAANKVNKVALKNGKGQYVAPSVAAAQKFLNAQTAIHDSSNTLAGDATDGTLSIDFTKQVSGAYQLSIVTYGIGHRGGGAATDLSVRGFFTNVVNTCLPKYGPTHGYVPLSGALKAQAATQIAAIG